jgi:hypothetical protein
MCNFSRHTTSLLSGIASLECRVVKISNQGAGSLFTGAEFLAILHCRSYSNQWVKPYRAFGIIEEGNLLDNFGIQSLAHFCLKNVRKLILKQAMWNCFWARRAGARRRARLATLVRRRTAGHALRSRPATAGPWQAPRALCAYGSDTPSTPRPATRGRCAHARGSNAIHHWPEPRRTSPTALPPMPWFL